MAITSPHLRGLCDSRAVDVLLHLRQTGSQFLISVPDHVFPAITSAPAYPVTPPDPTWSLAVDPVSMLIISPLPPSYRYTAPTSTGATAVVIGVRDHQVAVVGSSCHAGAEFPAADWPVDIDL